MYFDPLDWYCQSVQGGIWYQAMEIKLKGEECERESKSQWKKMIVRRENKILTKKLK